MQTSITQRLTLMSAVITAGVLGPVTFALYWTVDLSIERESLRGVQSSATHFATLFVDQLDDDYLIEFKGSGRLYQSFSAGADDWAIARGRGEAVVRSGRFETDALPTETATSRLVVTGDGSTFRVAASPLLVGSPPDRAALPSPVRTAVEETYPGAELLRAKRVVSKGRSLIELSVLHRGMLWELEIDPDGVIVDEDDDDLPVELPPDLVDALASDGVAHAGGRLIWGSHAGHVVAIVAVTHPDGRVERVGLNRFGERFDVTEDGKILGHQENWRLFVVIAEDAAQELAARRSLSLAIGIGGPLTWLAMVLAGWFLARRAMAPVQGIVDAARSIDLTNVERRLPTGEANDEISRIAITVNDMLDRIESAYHREKEFAGDASHELRSPVAAILAEIQLALSRDRSNAEYRDTLTRCMSHAATMERLVASLLLLSRLEAGSVDIRRERIDMGELAMEVIDRFPADDVRRIRLELESREHPAQAFGERDLLGILLHNLIENAIRYSPEDSTVTVRLAHEGADVVIRVEDEGPGIPEEQRDSVFDRFVRLEKSRARQTGGVGLGLSIVRAIATAHESRLVLARRDGGGTVASVYLRDATTRGVPTATPS